MTRPAQPDHTGTALRQVTIGPALMVLDGTIIALRTLDDAIPPGSPVEQDRRRLAGCIYATGRELGIPHDRLTTFLRIAAQGGALGPLHPPQPWTIEQ